MDGGIWLALLALCGVGVYCAYAEQRDHRRQRAPALLDLMFAEDEQEWARLKAVAVGCGLTIDRLDESAWRSGYLLMSEDDRLLHKWTAAQLVHGARLPLPGVRGAARSLFAYLRSHGVRPRDCRPYFDLIGMPDMRKPPAEGTLARQLLQESEAEEMQRAMRGLEAEIRLAAMRELEAEDRRQSLRS